MTLPEHFNAAEQVRYVGHPGHVPPPILIDREGKAIGHVVEALGDGLYRVQFGEIAPVVQLHADQLELMQ